MKLNKILYISILTSVLFVVGCSSSSGDDTPPPPTTGGDDDDPVVVIPTPGAATLVFPEDNTECNTGVVDLTDETKSAVTFEWNAAENADRYTLTITNLNTSSSIFATSNTNEATVTIDRSTPYSWVITSRAIGTIETTDSETFRFFNEGPGVENYAPFPAEAIAPARGVNLVGTTTTVTLEWSGSDVDNDITGYEVFFGTEADPTSSIGSGAETTLANVAVTSGTTYYWKIVTTDSVGNTSSSEVFSFRVG
ncbi:hypothetical protein [Croceitalea rosinachiae]|uniref:Fibronectin type-III domain-containing protein n=1 Tax=Croceitalea rosinachiae TaxID=3075596 RepID=A0ABU3A9N0_9FLAO|nr:hypothetical protein [Croceitalea sp. F388]MDT0606894.1 hypothetical protein [Croceitalea sp. F388]